MKYSEYLKFVFSLANSNGKFRIIRKGFKTLFEEGFYGLKKGIKKKSTFYKKLKKNEINENIARTYFFEQQNEFSLEEIKKELLNFKSKPLISIIMPTYNTPRKWLHLAIESVIKQYYENWELCIVDNGSREVDCLELLKYYEINNNKINIQYLNTNQGISNASNIAIDMSHGEYIGLLDHDDELTPDALFWIVKEINKDESINFIYSDECKIDDTDHRNLFHFFFKPDWSPELLLGIMYTGHFTVYRASLVKEIGGFRSEYDFSQDYDLAFRMSEKTENIKHIERVLYLWRSIPGSAAQDGKPWARISNINALKNHMERNKIESFIVPKSYVNKVKLIVEKNKKVSIIIPSDSLENIKNVIYSILTNTSYQNYEILIVTNTKIEEYLKNETTPFSNIKFIKYDKTFNFSEKCNIGAEYSNSEIFVFLNDDIAPKEESWLNALVEYLDLKGIGAVSPKLIYENGLIQYSGMFTGAPGFIGTSFSGYSQDEFDEFNTLHRVLRNVSILSGACFAIKKELYTELNGFDEINTPNGHSDIDLSFRILEKNLRIICNPDSVLIHKGNHSWHKYDKKNKVDIYLMKKWAKYLSRDTYFTDSMRKFLYRDFSYTWKFYGKEDITEYTKCILLISHEMSLTGAPMVLLNLARIIKNNGDYVTIISRIDGKMREILYNEGFHIIINDNLFNNDLMFSKFAYNYDVVIGNTILSLPVIKYLMNDKIYWWIHEGTYAISEYMKINKKFLEDLESIKNNKNINIIAVSKYTENVLKKMCKLNVKKILELGIPDEIVEEGNNENKDKKIEFLLAGSIEPRKGQDIFVEAISKLRDEILIKAEFKIIGKVLDVDYYNILKEKVKNVKQIRIFNEMDHKNIIKIINEVDIVVAPSRDDPFSIILCEAMMNGKACISSNKVGISEYIEMYDCGWIFEIENVEQLKSIIENIIIDNNIIKEKGYNSRVTYLKNFTMEKFKERYNKIIK